MAVLLAIGAAVGWGAADFLGGASRRDTPVLVIVCVSELIGLVALVPVLVVRGIPLPTDPRMLLAVVAGIAVTVELGLIYLALSRGDAFITAPVGALGAAVAVTFGLVGGDPLDPMLAAGLLCALVGASTSALTTDRGPRGQTALRSATICAGAAGGVATMLICFHAAGTADPYWATAAEHASTALSAGVIALARNHGQLRERLPERAQVSGLVQVGLTGVGGDLAYAAASRHGALSITCAISSLYPLTTAALGVAIQGRRANRVQAAAFVVALAGAALLGV